MSTSSSHLVRNPAPDAVVNGVPAWKHELNERLQATRARHTRKPTAQPEQPALPSLEHLAKPESRTSRLAAKVAERYANAPSYSEMLAAEARAAARAAEAAAEAARQVCAAVEAMESAGPEKNSQPASPAGSGDLVPGTPLEDSARDQVAISMVSPLEEALVSPAQPLPVNLIEFPRELVAPRRARPRLAEGPLRESYEEMAHDQSQLRIFEVEPESISKAVKIDATAPEWSSIRLDAKPASMLFDDEAATSSESPLEPAPLEDRLMAGIFDIALVLLAFVLFVLVFAACTVHPPAGKSALMGAGLVLAGLLLLYQYLFFRFADGTPGMRYARIALCTFEDENPTRKAMRRRILFLLLSVVPFGLGFVWAFFDAERLGWHDRLSRMYQRSYR